MTKLQRAMLMALDVRGKMSLAELESLFDVRGITKGGFRGSLMLLEKAGLVDGWPGSLHLTGAGVRAVEAANVADEAKG